jgi:imidazolonepropionase-like amidohydrolase
MRYRTFYLLLFILIPLCSQGQYAPAVLVLENAILIDVSHRTVAEPQTIMIKDGRIAEILASGSMAIPEFAVIINLKGKYLLPGLIDSHVHLATDPSGTDSRPHTLLSLEQMLYSGITTVRDMAGDARVLAGIARDANSGEIPSPNIYYSALMAGPKFFIDPRTQTSTKGGKSGDMPYMKAVADATDLRIAVAEAKGSGASGIKLYANLSAGTVAKILVEAKKQSIPVWAHAWLQAAKPSDLVSSGAISISHAPLLIYEAMDNVPDSWKKAHYSAADWDKMVPNLGELFSLMKQRHTVFDATLLTYQKWAVADTSMAWDYEIAKRITARAYAAGVSICAGTDLDQEQFVQEEMKLLVKDGGLSPIDAIVSATINGAAALNMNATKGSISPGKDADLLILSRNPLKEINNIDSVEFVIKGGRIYQKE